MLFNSGAFAIFLPIVFFLYWIFPPRFRWAVLLLSSCYFYMSWNAAYILLIGVATLVSYVSAILIERNRKHGKALLVLPLAVCFGILFFFKYFNFFSGNFTALLQRLSIPVHPVTLNVLLPVGISFYTFQSMSYVIDVYRGKASAERHLGKYAAFITFFPQLVAGPIERTENLLPQIKSPRPFEYDHAADGLRIMAWGFFKKLVIADTLAVYVDLIYNDIFHYHGLSLLVATVFFAFQIYCDFSGYSDIAIGTAKLFGIDLMRNFTSPYFSSSLREFWQRWHISLSTWFRDYVYIPLGGSWNGRQRTVFNTILTFLLSGLWHGANWTFVIWGAMHGLLQVLERPFLKKHAGHSGIKWLRILVVFLLVTALWAFFRADSFREAIHVFSDGFSGIRSLRGYILRGYRDLHLTKLQVLKISLSLLALLGVDALRLKKDVLAVIRAMAPGLRWSLYFILVLWILLYGSFGSNQFVYFQF